MTATTCSGRVDDEVVVWRTRARTELRAGVWAALDLPGTAAEIRQRIGMHLYRFEFSHYPPPNGQHCAHLSDDIYNGYFRQSRVQQELVRLERHGLVDRLIIPSVQAHLWWRL